MDELTIRWVALDGIQADNDSQDGNYLVWNFGPLDHGESATVHVSVPAHTAQNYSPDAAATDSEMYYDDSDQVLVFFFVLLLVIIVIALITVSVSPQTGSGTVVLARMTPTTGTGIPTGTPISMLPVICPPPEGYHRVPPPANFKAGGGKDPRRWCRAAQRRFGSLQPFQLRVCVCLCFQLCMRLRVCGRRPRRVQYQKLL